MSLKTDKFITIIICSVAIIFGITVRILPNILFLQGKSSLEKKEYVKAYKSLKQAYSFDKNNIDLRYYYVQSLIKLKPNKEVQKAVFEIATSDKNDSAQQLAQIQISKWKYNVLKNIGDNYIEQAPLDNGILRWDVEQFPIKVYVQSNIKIPDYYLTEIRRALSQWQSSTGFLKFKEIENQKNANIIIKIEPLPQNICENGNCKFVVGYTTPNIKGNFLKDMTIILYDKDPNNNYYSDKELYNTILHEIGHALGIMGHSYSSEDLMYMSSSENNNLYSQYRSSFQYLSSKDINTIKLLYKLIPNVTNSVHIETKGLIYAPIILGTSKDISKRKLKEAQNYIKKAPDLAGGYIDLGIAYSEMQKPKDAIKAMLKALELSKTNEEKYLSSFNLGAMYFNIKDYKSAQEYAIFAQNISNTEEVQELLTEIRHAINK